MNPNIFESVIMAVELFEMLLTSQSYQRAHALIHVQVDILYTINK